MLLSFLRHLSYLYTSDSPSIHPYVRPSVLRHTLVTNEGNFMKLILDIYDLDAVMCLKGSVIEESLPFDCLAFL